MNEYRTKNESWKRVGNFYHGTISGPRDYKPFCVDCAKLRIAIKEALVVADESGSLTAVEELLRLALEC